MGEKIEKDWGKVREESEESVAKDEEFDLSDALSDEIDEESIDLNQGSLEHLSYEELEEKLTLTEQESFANKEKSVRAMAELDNVRRRAERDVSNAHRYGLERFIDSLLPVLDSLEQSLDVAQKNADGSMVEGLELTMKIFLDVLEKHNVKRFDPLGETFNPQVHEAMSMQPTADAEPNTIMAVFQNGYTLNDRVIRPARVVVAKEEK